MLNVVDEMKAEAEDKGSSSRKVRVDGVEHHVCFTPQYDWKLTIRRKRGAIRYATIKRIASHFAHKGYSFSRKNDGLVMVKW